MLGMGSHSNRRSAILIRPLVSLSTVPVFVHLGTVCEVYGLWIYRGSIAFSCLLPGGMTHSEHS